MKGKIISNTIMFILILIFVMLFQQIFGPDQKMVGIVILIIGLVISEKDTTQNPKVLTVGLLIVNLWMGIASCLTLINPLIGLIVDLTFIFYVTYVMVQGNKKPYHFPFILGYLFLIYSSPAALSELPARLVSLAAGTFIIIGVQYLFNKNIYKKILQAQSHQVLNFLEKRIARILSKDFESYPEEAKSLAIGMKRFMKVTYERRTFKGPLSPESMQRITEMITLEKMYYLLGGLANDFKSEIIDESLLLDIQTLIVNFKNNDFTMADQLIAKWKDQELPESVEKLKEALILLKASQKNEYPVYKSSLIKQIIKEVDKDSLAFKFALRLSFLLSAGMFLTSLFNLEYGRWLCFTILALVQPGYEESNKKTLMRFTGTLLGAVLFLVLFNIFTDTTAQMMIVLLSSYIGMYINRYDLKMVTTTIQALGAAVIGTTGMIVVQNRIAFVIIGAIVAYIGNKYLLTIREKQVKEHYDELYEQYKTHLLQDPKSYPHSIIVEAYHVLEMGEELNKYPEWLDISFNTLIKSL